MRKTYHLCLSSHEEVMFRSEADLCRGFNALALAILETDSRLLAEGFLTTHFHQLVQTAVRKKSSGGHAMRMPGFSIRNTSDGEAWAKGAPFRWRWKDSTIPWLP